jgi:hypothetical protein
MKQQVNFEMFVDGFRTRKDNFSYDALKALFHSFEEIEEDTSEEIEFDPIAICCDYTEYSDFEDLKKDYNVETMEELESKTVVIRIPSEKCFIIQNY